MHFIAFSLHRAESFKQTKNVQTVHAIETAISPAYMLYQTPLHLALGPVHLKILTLLLRVPPKKKI